MKIKKGKIKTAIILLLLIIIAIIGVIEYKNISKTGKIGSIQNNKIKEQKLWTNEEGEVVLEVTEEDITTKEITVKVKQAQIESDSEQDLVYKYYVKETNKLDYKEGVKYTGAEKTYKYNNLKSGKKYDVKVEVINSKTKEQKVGELKGIETKEIPDAKEELEKGNIIVSSPVFNEEKGSVNITTTTGLKIECQINTETEGSWVERNSVNNLKNGDILKIRLTDGKNKGKVGSVVIGEAEKGELTITKQEATTEEIEIKVVSNNKEYRKETKPEYGYAIKKSSETNYGSVSYTETDSYKFSGLEAGMQYDIKVIITNKVGNKIQNELKMASTEEETPKIGDYVNYESKVTGYTDENGWRILNIEEGRITLISSNIVGNLQLKGIEGYKTGKEQLNTMCEAYGKGSFAEEARSITIEDINKITGYNPLTAEDEKTIFKEKIGEYGKTITFSLDTTGYGYIVYTDGGSINGTTNQKIFKHPNGTMLKSGTDIVEGFTRVNSINITNNVYVYDPADLCYPTNFSTINGGTITKGYDNSNEPYKMLFGTKYTTTEATKRNVDYTGESGYWLASDYEYVNVESTEKKTSFRIKKNRIRTNRW